MTSSLIRTNLPPLRWPPMGFAHGEALAVLLVPLLVLAGLSLWLHQGVGFLDRARLAEALSMMGHVRREVTLERALRPALRPPGTADSAVLTSVKTSSATDRLSLRYAREGDSIVARFQAQDDPGQHGAWALRPVESADLSPWVLNWRCSANSTTGRWRQIAQGVCPDESLESP